MSIEGRVKQVLGSHETSYHKRPVEKDWKWSCTCGQEKILATRELCVEATQDHWSVAVADELVDLTKPVAVAEKTPESVHEEEEPPVGLEIFSKLVRDVDCGLRTMPQARHALGEWWHAQDRTKVTGPGRDRMRRLKQITDALYEEFWSLAGSQS